MAISTQLNIVLTFIALFILGVQIGLHNGHATLFFNEPNAPVQGVTLKESFEITNHIERKERLAPVAVPVPISRISAIKGGEVPLSQPPPLRSTSSPPSPPPPPPPLPPSNPTIPLPLELNTNLINKSPIYKYLRQDKKKFPLVILACNREEYLRQTLTSILKVKGVHKEDVLVVQDGRHKGVEDLVKGFGLTLIQNVDGTNLRRGNVNDGASRIATHYKYAIDRAFAFRADCPAVVIIEDDFIFSPDFLEYFEFNSPILDVDETTYILSAWNDNGNKVHVSDKNKLQRTSYFPGLGWLLTRKLYLNELQSRWPTTHWDHWMRDVKQHKGRDCVYPEVPRDYHIGVKGTFMDDFHHVHYFRDIGYNLDPEFVFGGDEWEKVAKVQYDNDIVDLIRSATVLTSLTEFTTTQDQTYVIYINLPPARSNVNNFKDIAGYFQIWHELARGNYKGLHMFGWINGNYCVIVNLFDAEARVKNVKLEGERGRVWIPTDFKV